VKANTLKCDDLCTLIKACKENGVIEFSFDKLQISFRQQAIVEKAPTASKPIESEEARIAEPEPNPELERVREEEDKSAMLVLEDPLEMEKRIALGELVADET